MRSAFGFDGQKCSANSRVYVERSVAREFVDKLVERDAGHPRSATRPSARTGWARSSTSGRSTSSPTAVDEAKADGGTIEVGGEHRTTARGFFPTPTVVTGLPLEHRLFRDELFVPFLVVGEVDSLDEALREANDTRLRPHGRHLQPRPGRGAALPRHDPGRRRVREPARGRHDRRVARHPELRRLEGIGLVRQGWPRPVLRPAVPARAVADRRRAIAEEPRPMTTRTSIRGRGRGPAIRLVRRPAAIRVPRGRARGRRRWSRTASSSSTATDEEAALGRAVEMAPEYEDDFETDDGQPGSIRFEGIVAIKELDDPPAAGTEVWHEFMNPDPSRPASPTDRPTSSRAAAAGLPGGDGLPSRPRRLTDR